MPNKTTAVRLKVPKVVIQIAADQLNDVRRSRHVDAKIFLVELVHDPLELIDRFFRFLAVKKHDDVAGFAILRDQQPAPKRALNGVLEILRPVR